MTIIPYEYQTECLGVLQDARNSGKDRGLVVMGTGLGKTYTAALDVKQFHERYGRGRTLFLCHRNEILEQSSIPFSEVHGSGYTYGFYHGQNRFGHSSDFVFASLKTMQKRIRLFDRDEFDYVIVDESHHSKAETYEKTIEYWRPKFMLGLTATPDRMDAKNIQDIFGEILFNLPLETALARDLLTPIEYRLLSDEIDLSSILGEIRQGKSISIAHLNRKIFIPKRDEEIARIIKKHMDQIENPRVIIFCRSVRHAEKIAKLIEGNLEIHSKIKSGERQVRIELFRQGIIICVVTIDIFNEGIDIPQANLLVFLRCTSSKQVFFQQLGRGVRKSEGKKRLTVLDFVGNCERIQMVKELADSIRAIKDEFDFSYNLDTDTVTKVTHQDIELNVEGIVFDEKIIQVIDIINQVTRKRNKYDNWQEASKAAIELGITSSKTYELEYKRDDRLPRDPDRVYNNFPGWGVFLRTGRTRGTTFYSTWQEASKAAIELGLTSETKYKEGRKQDPRLPADPRQYYSDLPSYAAFYGKEAMAHVMNPYPTWQEASAAVKKLGITTLPEYAIRRKEDPRLPSAPTKYKEYPGSSTFFGKIEKILYKTWQEASAVVQSSEVKSWVDYWELRKKDPKLPRQPNKYYMDYPGFEIFFGIE